MSQKINKIVIFVFLFIFILFSFGCSSEDKISKSEFKMPADFEFEIFEVENIDGHKMEITTINHSKEYDLYEKWKKEQQDREAIEQIETARTKVRNDQELRFEEKRLVEWCNNLRSNSCLDMKWFRSLDECRQLEVECLLYNNDEICVSYDVVIKDSLYTLDKCIN